MFDSGERHVLTALFAPPPPSSKQSRGYAEGIHQLVRREGGGGGGAKGVVPRNGAFNMMHTRGTHCEIHTCTIRGKLHRLEDGLTVGRFEVEVDHGLGVHEDQAAHNVQCNLPPPVGSIPTGNQQDKEH